MGGVRGGGHLVKTKSFLADQKWLTWLLVPDGPVWMTQKLHTHHSMEISQNGAIILKTSAGVGERGCSVVRGQRRITVRVLGKVTWAVRARVELYGAALMLVHVCNTKLNTRLYKRHTCTAVDPRWPRGASAMMPPCWISRDGFLFLAHSSGICSSASRLPMVVRNGYQRDQNVSLSLGSYFLPFVWYELYLKYCDLLHIVFRHVMKIAGRVFLIKCPVDVLYKPV